MDINNYSYSNTSPGEAIIASCYLPDRPHISRPDIELTVCVNYFGEKFYTVSDIDRGYTECFDEYEDAAREYNERVPFWRVIPLF